jgi:signal transduction histidine kinase
VLDFIPAPDWRHIILERVRTGSEQPYEMMAVRKDGSRMLVEIQGRSITMHGKSMRVASVRDITERKLVEQQTLQIIREQAARAAAEASGQRAQLLAEASRVLGASFDYETTLATLARLAVPRFADFCTVDMAERDGTYRRIGVAHTDPEKEALLKAIDRFAPEDLVEGHPLRQVFTTGTPVMIREVSEEYLDQVLVSRDRRDMMRVLEMRSFVSVPLLSSGRVIGSLSLFGTASGRRFDGDDLALAEELARRASLSVENARLFQAAEQATRARDEMLSVVAHDLRNPLSTIMMSASLMLELPGTVATGLPRRQVEIVQRAAERMNRLIQDLLDVKRIESGQLVVDPRPDSASTVITEAMEMLRPLAAASSVQLAAELPGDLPTVLIDPPRIHQVLSNLVGNSIKFTPHGGRITVTAQAFPEEVRISVTDTGPGIAADQIPHLFARYWQGNRRDRRGIGLGLAIARGIVEAHGGRIWVESTLGEGSRFHFTLQIPNFRDANVAER